MVCPKEKRITNWGWVLKKKQISDSLYHLPFLIIQINNITNCLFIKTYLDILFVYSNNSMWHFVKKHYLHFPFPLSLSMYVKIGGKMISKRKQTGQNIIWNMIRHMQFHSKIKIFQKKEQFKTI